MVMGQECCFLSVAAGRISAIAVPLLLLVCCLGLRIGAQGIYTPVSVVRVYTDERCVPACGVGYRNLSGLLVLLDEFC